MSQADFSCAICYDTAAEPVVTRCGHLFCWACLNQWLHRPDSLPECPVCRGHVDERVPGSIIPLYGRGKRTQTSEASSGPQQQRPTADRAPPLQRPARAPRGNHPLSLGLGGSFFLFTGNMQTSIMLIIVWAVYHFAPWREWVARVQGAWGGAAADPPTPPPPPPPPPPPSSHYYHHHHHHHAEHNRSQEEEGRRRGMDAGQNLSPSVIVRNVLWCVVVAYVFHFIASTIF